MNGITNFSVDELRAKYGTIVPKGFEVIKWTLFHGQTYAQAGQTLLTFFNTIPTDPDLGNMEQSGAIPAPKKFFIRSIGIHLKPAQDPNIINTAITTAPTRANDVNSVFQTGHLEMTIGNKMYNNLGPLGNFPSPIVFDGASAVHFAQAMAADSKNQFTHFQNAKLHRDGYLVDPPVLIESQINFNVQLRWTAAQAISAASTIFVFLNGQMIRPIQ